jgi:predicted lipoprotein
MRRIALEFAGTVVALAIVVAAPGGAGAKTAEFDHAALAKRVLERHIRPGYAWFAKASLALDGALARHCREMSSRTRKAVDDNFDVVVTAWGRIEHITFGPVSEHQRLERIMFWPDRRGIGARQLANALRARDPAILERERLAGKSVAIQGLPALDTILFGTGGGGTEPAEAQNYRCAFAEAVAANLAHIATAIETEWSDPRGYAENWLAPAPGNPDYLKPSETTLALAKALDRGIERIRDQRIAGPLGLNPQRRRFGAVLAKSGRTLRLVAAGIEGLRDLYREGGMEAAIIASAGSETASSFPQLARLVSTELGTALEGASPLIGARRPFDDPRYTRRLIALGYPLKNARSTAGTLLGEAAGIPTGFNASDGD